MIIKKNAVLLFGFMTVFSLASVSGDSGGLILSQTNGYVMGIHQSGTSTGGNYCKVGNINYMLGTTLATW